MHGINDPRYHKVPIGAPSGGGIEALGHRQDRSPGGGAPTLSLGGGLAGPVPRTALPLIQLLSTSAGRTGRPVAPAAMDPLITI